MDPVFALLFSYLVVAIAGACFGWYCRGFKVRRLEARLRSIAATHDRHQGRVGP